MTELNTYAREIQIAREMLSGENTGRVGTPYHESENVLIVPFENGQQVAINTLKTMPLNELFEYDFEDYQHENFSPQDDY